MLCFKFYCKGPFVHSLRKQTKMLLVTMKTEMKLYRTMSKQGNKEKIFSIIISLTWIVIEYPGASFPRCECGITHRTSAAPVWLQVASPHVLLCQSSHEKQAMQRGAYHEKPRKMNQSFAEQTCSSWDADGVMLPTRPWACCTIPACIPFHLLGKGTPNEEHQNDAFLVMDSRWGFWSCFLNSLLTFLTLTMCTAWGAFGTQTAWCGIICYAQECHCSPFDSSDFASFPFHWRQLGNSIAWNTEEHGKNVY